MATKARRPIHPRWGFRLRHHTAAVRGPAWQVSLYLGPLTWWTAIQRVRPDRRAENLARAQLDAEHRSRLRWQAMYEVVTPALPMEGLTEGERLAVATRYRELLEQHGTRPESVDATIQAEIVSLAALFEYPRLARLCGTTEDALRLYATGERAAPDLVGDRLFFLAQLVAVLRGNFNDFGVRRWFERPHSGLAWLRPSESLAGDWDPAEDEAMAVLDAASFLLG